MNDTLLQNLVWQDPSELPGGSHWVEWQHGMVLMDHDGNTFLVGDVNSEGGVCDCCPSDITDPHYECVMKWAWLPGFEPAEEEGAMPDVQIRWLDD